jgi:ABC-type Mn2+/Zn2+ transport system permease subunit
MPMDTDQIGPLQATPAAAAQRLTAHPGRALAWSVGIALGCTLGGIACALYVPWPVGSLVSAWGFAAYLLARLAGSRGERGRAVRGAL